MNFTKDHATQIREIAGAIYGLSRMAEDDAIRDACEGSESVFGPFELGTINTAITHLANRVDSLAEAIEEESGLVGGGES